MRLDVIKAKILGWATCIVQEWNKQEEESQFLRISLNEGQDVDERMTCGDSLYILYMCSRHDKILNKQYRTAHRANPLGWG
jgi:hypothetical protein